MMGGGVAGMGFRYLLTLSETHRKCCFTSVFCETMVPLQSSRPILAKVDLSHGETYHRTYIQTYDSSLFKILQYQCRIGKSYLSLLPLRYLFSLFQITFFLVSSYPPYPRMKMITSPSASH